MRCPSTRPERARARRRPRLRSNSLTRAPVDNGSCVVFRTCVVDGCEPSADTRRVPAKRRSGVLPDKLLHALSSFQRTGASPPRALGSIRRTPSAEDPIRLGGTYQGYPRLPGPSSPCRRLTSLCRPLALGTLRPGQAIRLFEVAVQPPHGRGIRQANLSILRWLPARVNFCRNRPSIAHPCAGRHGRDEAMQGLPTAVSPSRSARETSPASPCARRRAGRRSPARRSTVPSHP